MMNALTDSVQGGFAYLLITEIVIISGLLLAFLFLLARRIQKGKEEPVFEAPMIAPMIDSRAPSTVLNGQMTAAMQSAEVQTAPLVMPNAAPSAATNIELDELNAALGSKQKENESLRDKIQLLESKLLEYEILQEEIGSLSALKVENQKLKAKITEIEQNPGQQVSTGASPQETPKSSESNVSSTRTTAASVPGEGLEINQLIEEIDNLSAQGGNKG